MRGEFQRHRMPAASPEERIKNFCEVALGFDDALAKAEAERCLNCKTAPCTKGCPVGVRIPDFIAKIASGEMDAAAALLLDDNNLPAICGRVCPQENQCEKFCVRKEKLGGLGCHRRIGKICRGLRA